MSGTDNSTDKVPALLPVKVGEGAIIEAEDAGASFSIRSLRPEFDAAHHQLYVGYLQAELNRPIPKKKGSESSSEDGVRPRNVALTGSYGSGKSSILSKVVGDLSDRVVSVSLSTLGNEQFVQQNDLPQKDPLATPAITNAIQKEIVKQLLYREKPSSVPGSRYRRIEGFRKGRAFGVSVISAAVLSALALLTDATANVQKIFGNAVVPDVLIYIGVFFGALVIAQVLQSLFHNRVWIERLSSGPASISLTNKSESFFDQYLDELVYFFEANSYDVVVFEDLDRFNDPYIFETLRELNTLLNNSKQIEPKVISFVYAIKDSIFEQLGELSINSVKLSEEEIRQLAVTNRTKFFDVVIPVVPFISHRNARDLISQEMKRSGFTMAKPLLDLVSKHLVDMRLIKNIHNEFGVFRQKILEPGHLDELKPQPLFAMIVYKNLHMSDFEKVKEGTSKLDEVYKKFRELVNAQIASTEQKIRLAQTKKRKLDLMDARAKALGDGLEKYLERLMSSAGQSLDRATLTLSAAVTLPQLHQTNFWKSWLENESLRLTLSYQILVQSPYNSQQQVGTSLSVSVEDLRAQLDDSLALDEWQAADSKTAQKAIDDGTALRDFLKTATMEDLAERDDLLLDTENGAESFAAIAERYLGKGLAFDLIQAGHIDRNFSLYVSLYYDDTVTAQARNYILHSVESNTVDIYAPIGTGAQIDAMLDEVGLSIFSERSIYNIQLLDHLLAKEDARLDRSMRLIAGDGDEDVAIRTAYFSSGKQQEQLVTRLAPIWPGVLEFLVVDESVSEEQRSVLLNIALLAVSGTHSYLASPALKHSIELKYLEMGALTGNTQIDSVDAVVAVLSDARVKFASLSSLSKELKPFAIRQSLYELTGTNLIDAIDGEPDLALDKLRAASESVFDYSRENLSLYLEAQDKSETTPYTIASSKNFVAVLNELANKESSEVLTVAERSSNVVVTKIAKLDEKLWGIVARTEKLAPNFSNIASYLEKRGDLDDDLVIALRAHEKITEIESADEPAKFALALTLLTSDQLDYHKRVHLAVSLALTTKIPVNDLHLAREDPGMAGAVLAEGIIEDSAASFEALGTAAWPVKSAYIQASEAFADYVRSITLSRLEFAALAQDKAISDGVKEIVVLNLDDFASSTGRDGLNALANFAISKHLAVGPRNLLAMATASVEADSLVQLIALEIDSISLDGLLEVLKLMPDKYRKLTTTNGQTKIPLTPADLRMIDHLVAIHQVSSRDHSPHGSEFKVNLRRS